MGDGHGRGRRWRALGGVVGPIAFVLAWWLLGRDRSGYSPRADPISELAAVDAPGRWAMTAAFGVYGLGVSAYAAELRTALPGRAALAALVTAIGTIGVALTPLGSALGGTPHAVAAGVSYIALALLPVLGGWALREDRPAWARISVVTGIAIGVALILSVALETDRGLWQRVGLTIGDVWIVGSACWIFTGTRVAARQAGRRALRRS